MRARGQKGIREGQKSIAKPSQPRSLAVAQAGIQTGGDFAKMMSCLMSDLIEGTITPQVGNATVNAGGKLLKVVELQFKYGKQMPDGTKESIDLLGTSEVAIAKS